MKRKPKIGSSRWKIADHKAKFRIAWLVAVIIAAVCVFCPVAISAGNSNIENTQAALEKWIETQHIISREKRDLLLAREMLNGRIELLQREINLLHGKINETKESIAEADKKRADMIEENEKFKKASASLADTLILLEERTRQLLQRLPDPIQERVKPLSQRLPDNAKETKLTIAERFQNVVGILNEIDKFNREILVTSEVRTLSDGSSVEVTTMYVGIGQAYYAAANGNITGTAKVSDKGWEWEQNDKDEVAAQITEAIAILKNEKVASFVKLPVTIK